MKTNYNVDIITKNDVVSNNQDLDNTKKYHTESIQNHAETVT